MISHLFLELYQPILILIAGFFSYKVLTTDRECVCKHKTRTHLIELYLISKLSIITAWLMVYPVTVHIVHEASGRTLLLPITDGPVGIVLQASMGLAYVVYAAMSAHLWAKSLDKFKTRYFLEK